MNPPAVAQILAMADSNGWEACVAKGRTDRENDDQFFTPPAIARYLAGWFRPAGFNRPSLRLLDPGAGGSALTAAVVDIPRQQQKERSALTLLALADIKPHTLWKMAVAPLRRITEMMDWMRDHCDIHCAPNTRETIRRQTVHQFVQHGVLIENPAGPDRPMNNGSRFLGPYFE